MSQLPHDELLSAYLDGEVTAAQRAEVERLLAESPAARQLLDELRALSGAVQGLPRAAVEKDLSGAVLQAATRRREESSGRQSAPLPFTPAISRRERGIGTLRRFINRRSMAWLALAATVALMITIHDHWQAVQNANLDKRVALAPAQSATVEKKEVLSEAAAQRRKFSAEPQNAPAGLKDRDLRLDVAKTKPADAPSIPSMSAWEPAADKAKQLAAPAAPTVAITPPATAQNRVDALLVQPQAQQALVVHCDISPAAAGQQSFEKLLASNGILPGAGELDETASNEVSGVAGRVEPKRDEMNKQLAQPQQAKEKGQLAAAMGRFNFQQQAAAISPRGENYLYFEAAPEQIAATLASLQAQPSMYSNIRIKPAIDQKSQSLVSQYQNQYRNVTPAEQQRRAGGSGYGGRALSAGKPQASSSAAPAQDAKSPNGQVTYSRQLQPAEDQSGAGPAALRQQVLFVVRVAPQNPATAGESVGSTATDAQRLPAAAAAPVAVPAVKPAKAR